MRRSTRIVAAALLLVSMGIIVFLGCTSVASMDMDTTTYKISLLNPKHFHAFTTTDTLFFEVRNESGEPKAGLTPRIVCQMKGSSVVDTTMDGQVIDNNDGRYFWRTTFLGVGFYTITFSFDREDMTYSNTFPFEATPAGGERIFCPDATSPQHNYQVRWNAVPGVIHGGDSVQFLIELKRCFATTVNTTQPWTNPFDHLTPEDLLPAGSIPAVKLGSGMGETDLVTQYKGLGIYSAKALIPSSAADTMWIRVMFEDSCGTFDENGATSKDYRFPVMSGAMAM